MNAEFALVLFALAILLWLARPPKSFTAFLNLENQKTALQVRVLKNYLDKKIGLLNHVELRDGTGVLLWRCNRVHTKGMAFPIDVVFLDSDFSIVEVYQNIPSGLRKIVGKKKALHTLEIPANTASLYPLKVGQRLFYNKSASNFETS